MKKQLFSYLLLLMLAFSVSAQKVKQSKFEKNLRKHVSYLASDALEGRRAGEKGGTFAAGYVANMFARYKLKGGFAGNSKGKSKESFLQPFEYIAGVELGKNNSLTLNGRNLNLKTDWMPIGYTPNGSFSNSPIIFAGFGISSKRLKYNDYSHLNVRNKIALVLGGNPDNGNPHSLFGRIGLHAKSNIAKEKGAKALIIVARDETFSDEKLAQLKFDQTLGELTIPTIVISRKTAANLFSTSEKGLQEIEKWMAKKKETPATIQIKLAKNFEVRGDLTVRLKKKRTKAYNVIGIIKGRDPILKNEAIVIGAHYDHLGRGGQGSLAVNSTEIHHGADDNASGTSALIELARQFRKAKSNKRTLIFISFGAEEEGLLGSKHYVNNPVFPLNKTIAMINMDMVGRLRRAKLNVGGIGTAGLWENLIKARAKSRFHLGLTQDGFGPSDHSSFYGKKIPVLFFFTGTHKDYHKPSDTAEKINYRGLESIGKFVSELVEAVDQNPKRPVYKVAKSAGMSGGRRGFNVSLGTVPNYSDSNNDGLLLDGVRDNSAAAKAGIKEGDKIIKLAGKEIRNISDYVFVLGEMKAGREYEVIVIRGKDTVKLKIVPTARK